MRKWGIKLRSLLWRWRWGLLVAWLVSAPLQLGSIIYPLVMTGKGWMVVVIYGGLFLGVMFLLWRQGPGGRPSGPRGRESGEEADESEDANEDERPAA